MKRWVGRILVICLVFSILPMAVQAAPSEVNAKSALLMDIATGTVLYEQDAHKPLPPASVTKVMTMLLIMEAIDAGQIRWDDIVTASEEAAAKGGSQIYLKVGETMSVTDMVKSIAVSSANDCACAMAEHIAGSESAFVDMMNLRAQQLGMKDTNFVNCTGLDDGENAKAHLTSAYDIALMSRELMKQHPDIQKFTTIWMDTVRNGSFGLSNTNKMVRFYPGATGLKTGFTSGAGYCLSATAEKDDMHLVAVVMGSETSKDRFAACKALLDYGFSNFATIQPAPPENPQVPVVLGTVPFITAIPRENPPILVEKRQKNSVTTEYTLEESVTAPVSKGQKLGMMTVKIGEQVISQIPLVAETEVTKRTWGDLVIDLLRQICMAK